MTIRKRMLRGAGRCGGGARWRRHNRTVAAAQGVDPATGEQGLFTFINPDDPAADEPREAQMTWSQLEHHVYAFEFVTAPVGIAVSAIPDVPLQTS